MKTKNAFLFYVISQTMFNCGFSEPINDKNEETQTDKTQTEIVKNLEEEYFITESMLEKDLFAVYLLNKNGKLLGKINDAEYEKSNVFINETNRKMDMQTILLKKSKNAGSETDYLKTLEKSILVLDTIDNHITFFLYKHTR